MRFGVRHLPVVHVEVNVLQLGAPLHCSAGPALLLQEIGGLHEHRMNFIGGDNDEVIPEQGPDRASRPSH